MNQTWLQRICAPMWLLAVLAWSAPAMSGQTDEDQDLADAEAMVAAAHEEERLRLRETAVTLEARLEELGNEAGLYDLSLAEIQTDLGRVYVDLGDYDKATDVLTQALHLVRLNNGLYDPRQIRVLEELVEALVAKADWEQVDNYQHLVFSLQKRSYEPDSPEFADAVLTMGQWQLAAGRLGRVHGFQALSQISDIKELYASQLEHARAREDLARQWSLIYATALADVALARQYLRSDVNEMMVSAQRYVNQTVCRNVPDGAGGYNRVCWQQSVPNPDYYYQVNNERRNRLDRARVSLNAAQRQLQEILDNNPEFASTHADDTQVGLENLNRELRDLQRDSRMRMMGVW